MACGGGKQDKPSKETTSNIEQESTSSQSGGATTDKDDSSGSSDVNKETTSDDVTTKQEETSKQEETTTKQPDSGSNGNTGNTGNTGNSGNNSSQGTSVTDFGVITPSGKYTSVGTRVSVHDPSIEYDATSGQWYIFGSHTAFARTKNLINWTMFEKEGTSNAKYGAIFAKSGEYAARGGAGYDIKGNLWAPDVIYNKDMKKWCMYRSVNGSNFYSSIAMATADSIEGPYTYQGTVVWSGMTTADDVAQTDYKKVTGTTDVSRYTSQGWWYYGTNAIDPCVLYDKDGQLWMVYGSWFGGLFMLKLDNKTGLRDY
ncbi:MAG: family 43 glycosylhydrolase, partial [Lachnospiraceae bacterium]|nr:family 43 glycosylhydrolase [Lachnospiraceae bacterium]